MHIPTFCWRFHPQPGYQNVLKDLKPSTRQRFISIDFDYPHEAEEARIIHHASRVAAEIAADLAHLGARVRTWRKKAVILMKVLSTRLLVYAGQLIVQGI